MPFEAFKHIPKKKLVLASGDGFLTLAGLGLASAVITTSGFALPPIPVIWLVLATIFLAFYLANLYRPLSPPHQKNKILARLVLAVGGAAGFLAIVSFSAPGLDLGRQRLLVISLFMVPAGYLWRVAFEQAPHVAAPLIVGSGVHAVLLLDMALVRVNEKFS